MFSDPLIAVMTMLILFFAGMVLMFLHLLRVLGVQREEFREGMRKQQMFLSDVEQQLQQLGFSLRTGQENGDPGRVPGAAPPRPAGDIPLLRQEDPLLSMLEGSARMHAAPAAFDDHLLPPPPVSRPAVEEYDPATDPNLFEDAFLSGPDMRSDRLKRGG